MKRKKLPRTKRIPIQPRGYKVIDIPDNVIVSDVSKIKAGDYIKDIDNNTYYVRGRNELNIIIGHGTSLNFTVDGLRQFLNTSNNAERFMYLVYVFK